MRWPWRRRNWRELHEVDVEQVRYIMGDRSNMTEKTAEEPKKKAKKKEPEKPHWFHV